MTGLVTAGLATGSDLEQTYYLGVFDPQEQLPPTLYRVRVRGQGSALSNVKYRSGWVPAVLVDSLQSQLKIDWESGAVDVDQEGDIEGLTAKDAASVDGLFASDRRLMLFGPEGFRQAPTSHRLAIVMGGNPEALFEAVNETLGAIGKGKLAAAGKARQDALEDMADDLELEAERMQALGELLAFELEGHAAAAKVQRESASGDPGSTGAGGALQGGSELPEGIVPAEEN
ncbi:MAG: hypothetical protein P1V81_18565 [Planctomycetota bacterium]|nr:hypothetical protein [Planctomycetota bacterium]